MGLLRDFATRASTKPIHPGLDFRFVRKAELAGSDRWSDRGSEEGGVLGRRRCCEFDAYVAITGGVPPTSVWNVCAGQPHLSFAAKLRYPAFASRPRCRDPIGFT